MKTVISAIIAILMLGSCSIDSERPNIIFIMSDDHTSQAISVYGGMLADVAPTPNIDRIGQLCILESIPTKMACTNLPRLITVNLLYLK